ncbi:unnamed protein product [Mycena citricolor]|uniref:Uncharacterized protein n=1 Tax=Mycena citricolor TaxID=2018698 RepID=A0AAD2K635_9AGAR|nr:unnamed protein product [Mycena citricolor]
MRLGSKAIHPDLFQLFRGYSSLRSPTQLAFPSHLGTAAIHEFLLSLLTSEHLQTYPPSLQYQKTFWKWVIPLLERKLASEDDDEGLDLEIDSRIYSHYLGLLNASDLVSGPPAESYITYIWQPPGDEDSYETTTLRESRTLIESGTTGLRTWLASFVLAQYLVAHPAIVCGKRVLELGAGIGFLGSVVGSIQILEDAPNSIWLSDVNESVLVRCQANVQLECNRSASHPSIQCRFLDWSVALDPAEIDTVRSMLVNEVDADIILGADIVFDPTLIPALVAILRLALSTGRPKTALIALTVRNPDTMDLFVQSVGDNGLKWKGSRWTTLCQCWWTAREAMQIMV